MCIELDDDCVTFRVCMRVLKRNMSLPHGPSAMNDIYLRAVASAAGIEVLMYLSENNFSTCKGAAPPKW